MESKLQGVLKKNVIVFFCLFLSFLNILKQSKDIQEKTELYISNVKKNIAKLCSSPAQLGLSWLYSQLIQPPPPPPTRESSDTA